jgi:CBS domain containing-hemolysin-like protein
MVPRVDMVTLPNTVTLNQLSKFIQESGHSRIPIYKDAPDNIIGILHVKDLLPLLSTRSKKELELEEIIREPYFIPDTKHISEVFKDMRFKRIHLAIVVDEYGGVSGLLTLEDLLEELVGEIQDEYDEEEEQVKKVNGNTYILAADMSIDEVNTALDIEITGENFDTLAGYMIDRLGHLGKTGEKVETKEYTFVIDQVKKWRILKVKAIIHNKSQKDSK